MVITSGTKKGAAEDPHRTAGQLAGQFEGVNARLENGTLKFTQKFNPKPIATWADNVDIVAQMTGDVLTFRNQWVNGVKLTRAMRAKDCHD